MPQFRQLAAIMFIGIVGYTALMVDDAQVHDFQLRIGIYRLVKCLLILSAGYPALFPLVFYHLLFGELVCSAAKLAGIHILATGGDKNQNTDYLEFMLL